MEPKILYSKAFSKCTNQLTPIFANEFKVVGQAFEYSGKGLSDLENEKECLRLGDQMRNSTNFTYLQLRYEIIFSKGNNDEDLPVMRFLNQSTYYTGFCMFSDCMPIMERVFNATGNDKFADFLLINAGLIKNKTEIIQINNWNEYYDKWAKNETTGEEKDPKVTEYNKYIFITFFWFSTGYFICKLVASIIRIAFVSSGYDKTYTKIIKRKKEEKKKEQQSAQKSKDESSSYSDVLNDSKEVSNNIFSVSSITVLEGDPNDDTDFPLQLKIIKILDLSDNFGQLSSDKTMIYKGIEPLFFYRIVILFFMVFNHNMYTLIF